MDATILRSDVLKILDNGEPFEMELVTADRKRGTGGDLIELRGWQKIVGDRQPAGNNSKFNIQNSTLAPTRNPNHRTHKTINLHNPNNPRLHPITAHIRLIQFFNGKRVLNG